ncbi:MAG: serine hydroxymethyltransferase [Pseudomonadota bacterium]
MTRDRKPTSDAEGYILEFVTIGSSTKASAVDPLTGLEVSVVGPPQSSRHDLARLAIKKLQRRLGLPAQEKRHLENAPYENLGDTGQTGSGLLV